MNITCYRASIAAIMLAGAPANASLSLVNTASTTAPSSLTTTDGTPAVASYADATGFASALATSENNGTAYTSAGGSSGDYQARAAALLISSFDFPAQYSGKVSVKVTGWAIASGGGLAQIFSVISVGNSTTTLVGNTTYRASTYATEDSRYGTILPGLQKISLSKTLNWKGGNSLYIRNTAIASTSGLGFASAYVDPVINISAVPEPASWALLLAGFGLVGAAMRRRALAIAFT